MAMSLSISTCTRKRNLGLFLNNYSHARNFLYNLCLYGGGDQLNIIRDKNLRVNENKHILETKFKAQSGSWSIRIYLHGYYEMLLRFDLNCRGDIWLPIYTHNDTSASFSLTVACSFSIRARMRTSSCRAKVQTIKCTLA